MRGSGLLTLSLADKVKTPREEQCTSGAVTEEGRGGRAEYFFYLHCLMEYKMSIKGC